MEVRHQDSTIFDPMEKKGDTVEKLMPAPEQPVDKAEVLGKEPPVLDSKKPELNLEMQGDAVVAPVPTPEPEKIPEKIIEKAVENPSPAPAQEETPKKETATSSGDVYIQLGSYRNKAGAEKDWKTLQGKYSQLKGLSLKIERVDLGKKGIFYRLQAGKLTEARANEICAVLKKSNAGGCILVR
jgi:cell division protein FtsN